MNKARRNGSQRGAALLFALGLLVMFVALGAAYVGYMAIEQQRAYEYVASMRARQMAEQAVWSVVGDIQAAIERGELPEIGAREEELLPVYRAVIDSVPEKWQRRDARVRVSVEEESAKLNINHAPTRALQAMLEIDGHQARAIRGRLPRPGEAPAKDRRWFASINGLAARGLLSREALAQIEPRPGAFLTAHSVEDNRAPQAVVNVNAAPREVLAALFNAETADRIVTARAQDRFANFEELLRRTEADPATFNIDVPTNGETPPEIGFEPRSFRIASRAEARKRGESRAVARAEAVVVFSDTGEPVITYWSEKPAALEQEEAVVSGPDRHEAVAES